MGPHHIDPLSGSVSLRISGDLGKLLMGKHTDQSGINALPQHEKVLMVVIARGLAFVLCL